MSKNKIILSNEEDILKSEKLIKKCDECKLNECINCEISWTEIASIRRLIDDYKRVLKMNEVLSKENGVLLKENEEYYKQLDLDYTENNFVSKQRIEDIIDRIDYDIKKTKEIISKNTNVRASYRKNDYQIVRLKAMNTKSLDIKKRLQELLESEK